MNREVDRSGEIGGLYWQFGPLESWSLIRLEKVKIWVKWAEMEIFKETYISHKLEADLRFWQKKLLNFLK